MFVVIFGRPACPFCVRAKKIAETLSESREDFKFRYVDMHAEGVTKEELEKTVGVLLLNQMVPRGQRHLPSTSTRAVGPEVIARVVKRGKLSCKVLPRLDNSVILLISEVA